MANAILYCFAKLREGFVVTFWNKNRVISKSLVASRRMDNPAFAHAHDSFCPVPRPDNGDSALEACSSLFVWYVLKGVEQFPDSIRV
jgi:hypothetical protein